LIPGVPALLIGIGLYGLDLVDLIGFATAVLTYILIGWVYVAVSPAFAPRLSPPLSENPFAHPKIEP
jgi:hypothetical protein